MLPQKREIILNYMDIGGFVTIDKRAQGVFQKNGIMQTSFFIELLDVMGELDEHDRDAYYHTIMSCMVKDANGSYIYGLINRLPGCPDGIDWDDYRGMVSASKTLNLDFHKWVLSYGLKTRFSYDNTNPGHWQWWSFHGRFVISALHYFIANGRLTALTPVLWFLLTVNLLSPAGSGKLLDFMLINSMRKSFGWRLYRKFWMKFGRLSKSTALYFNDSTAPIVQLASLVESKL